MSESDRQLSEWVAGRPFHNTERDECCPDFSCCQPELLAPRHEREAFARADDAARLHMLGTFLRRMLETNTDDPSSIHIAGEAAPRPEV